MGGRARAAAGGVDAEEEGLGDREALVVQQVRADPPCCSCHPCARSPCSTPPQVTEKTTGKEAAEPVDPFPSLSGATLSIWYRVCFEQLQAGWVRGGFAGAVVFAVGRRAAAQQRDASSFGGQLCCHKPAARDGCGHTLAPLSLLCPGNHTQHSRAYHVHRITCACPAPPSPGPLQMCRRPLSGWWRARRGWRSCRAPRWRGRGARCWSRSRRG